MSSSAVPLFAHRPEGYPPPGAFAALAGREIMQAVPAGRLPAPPTLRVPGPGRTEVNENRLAAAAGGLCTPGSTTCPSFGF